MCRLALDSGQVREQGKPAQAEGLTRHRVAQVLDPLTLAPEIQAALDVPLEALPAGIMQKDVMALARVEGVEGVEAQRACFHGRWTKDHPASSGGRPAR